MRGSVSLIGTPGMAGESSPVPILLVNSKHAAGTTSQSPGHSHRRNFDSDFHQFRKGIRKMTDNSNSRRQLLSLAAMGTLAASAVAISAGRVQAYQGNMERAIGELKAALRSLREATPDKGGHKANAVNLIQQAIGEVQAGIAFATEHYGD
jgi:hypothetical protein